MIDRQLTGSIPGADLARLTGLTELALRGNSLTGSIPSEIGALTNLEHLDMSYSGEYSMGGLIPSEIGKLANLTWMNLGGNAFTGAGNGICAILANPVWNEFNVFPAKEWTDGALCPMCLTTGCPTKPCTPVNCTGPN